MTTLTLVLLFLFAFKHFIADFVCQTTQMVIEKGQYGAFWGIVHSAIHGLMTFSILMFATKDITLSFGVSFVDFATHYHIDWSKQQLSRNYTYTDKIWWFFMGLDQLLHYTVYYGIIWYEIGRAHV